MYDILNNWDELETQLKICDWNIDRQYDKESNTFDFTFVLPFEDDEIFKFYLTCSLKHDKGNINVYIDTFNAWSVRDLEKGMKALNIIYIKCKEFENWCKIQGYNLHIGRT